MRMHNIQSIEFMTKNLEIQFKQTQQRELMKVTLIQEVIFLWNKICKITLRYFRAINKTTINFRKSIINLYMKLKDLRRTKIHFRGENIFLEVRDSRRNMILMHLGLLALLLNDAQLDLIIKLFMLLKLYICIGDCFILSFTL